ncbi:MAG: hypothetical protein Ct9H300mP11_06990 [Chloroflexota bacterium]|nr:MAG: hypothetical protein Ct9H300mP11_06990 [Chloroflexota bacterium]
MTARQELPSRHHYKYFVSNTITSPIHDLVALPYGLPDYGTRGPHLNSRDENSYLLRYYFLTSVTQKLEKTGWVFAANVGTITGASIV